MNTNCISGYPSPNNYNYMVFVRTCTYNQSKYIEDCLKGVVNQNTDFPFVHFVIDDASTDGEQALIKNYIAQHCITTTVEWYENEMCLISIAKCKDNNKCTLVVYFLKQNMYNDPEKENFWKEWRDNCPYEAICEGDDYWFSSDKLNKQVNWMEAHPDYTMCCSDGNVDCNGKLIDCTRYLHDSDVSISDMVVGQGGFILTASILYRNEVLKNYPLYCKNCHVGDYPLQIWCSILGKVRYFSEKMVTYRYMSIGSWSNNTRSLDFNKRITNTKSILEMLNALNEYCDYKYRKSFETAIVTIIISLSSNIERSKQIRKSWKDEINKLSLHSRIKLLKRDVLLLLCQVKRKISV